jgi:hypothetical protein
MYIYCLGRNVRHNLTSQNTASYLRINSEVLTTVLLKILIFRVKVRWVVGSVLPDFQSDRSAVIFRVPDLDSLALNMHYDPQKRITTCQRHRVTSPPTICELGAKFATCILCT